MKTLYDIAKEVALQTLNEKKKKELECLFQTRRRELKNCICEYDGIEKIKAIKCDEIKIMFYVENGGCGNSGELFIVTQHNDEVIIYCFNANSVIVFGAPAHIEHCVNKVFTCFFFKIFMKMISVKSFAKRVCHCPGWVNN